MFAVHAGGLNAGINARDHRRWSEWNRERDSVSFISAKVGPNIKATHLKEI